MARNYLADCRKAKDEGLISSDLTFSKLQVRLGSHRVWNVLSNNSPQERLEDIAVNNR